MAERYWLSVFPRVRKLRYRLRASARSIPDPLLREVALRSQRKWGNVEGAAAFAALVPRSHRAAAARAMACYQAAYNYLDLLGEQPSANPAAGGRALHTALLAALDPDSRTHPDYYRYQPHHRDDGGYLSALVDGARAGLRELPSYPAVAPVARAAAERIVAFQSCNTGEVQGDLRELERWGRAIIPPGSDLCWWEAAAAGGSSLAVYALIALAGEPETSAAPAAADVQAVHDAYFPWIGALHSLLDNLIDTAEDRATGQHSLSGRYDSPRHAAARMGTLAECSLRAARALPHGRAHTLVLGAMAGFYLSTPQSRMPAASPIRRAVLDALDGQAALAMPVFRVRRLALGERGGEPAGAGYEAPSAAGIAPSATAEEYPTAAVSEAPSAAMKAPSPAAKAPSPAAKAPSPAAKAPSPAERIGEAPAGAARVQEIQGLGLHGQGTDLRGGGLGLRGGRLARRTGRTF
jgi:tetraprenyl-beta-curcumene synthase